MDFVQYLRNHPVFKEYWLDGLRFVDGDLASGESSISGAIPENVQTYGSIAMERQIAVYWLQGDERTYSHVSPNTLLSAC
jgi:hypothetical protein